MHDESSYSARWAALMAPRTGNIAAELMDEAAEYFGRAPDEVLDDIAGPEIFGAAECDAADAVPYRTLMALDIACRRPGRRLLDCSAGAGSPAIVFADAGFDVTIAGVSGPLTAFAQWRCERRGYTVRAINPGTGSLPATCYDVVVCFDLLNRARGPM